MRIGTNESSTNPCSPPLSFCPRETGLLVSQKCFLRLGFATGLWLASSILRKLTLRILPVFSLPLWRREFSDVLGLPSSLTWKSLLAGFHHDLSTKAPHDRLFCGFRGSDLKGQL